MSAMFKLAAQRTWNDETKYKVCCETHSRSTCRKRPKPYVRKASNCASYMVFWRCGHHESTSQIVVYHTAKKREETSHQEFTETYLGSISRGCIETYMRHIPGAYQDVCMPGAYVGSYQRNVLGILKSNLRRILRSYKGAHLALHWVWSCGQLWQRFWATHWQAKTPSPTADLILSFFCAHLIWFWDPCHCSYWTSWLLCSWLLWILLLSFSSCHSPQAS